MAGKPKSRMSNITLEGVKIGFRNFSGAEGKYNREGDRNFAVFIDDNTLAMDLHQDGWNIKWLKARDEDEEPRAYLQVSVNYKGRPPRITMLTSRGRTPMGQDEINILDWADIEHVDLIIRPYEWEVNDKTGVKAYLQSIFVRIREDELDLKYADVEFAPESAQKALNNTTEDPNDPPWS